MKSLILTTALVLATFAAGVAQSVAGGGLRVAGIDGPQTAEVGRLVELQATGDATAIAWGSVNPDADYRIYGRTLVFSAPRAGRYEFVVFAAVATADGKILVDSQRIAVTVGPGPAPVPPRPDPTPPPAPPTPDPFIPAPFAELTGIARAAAPGSDRDKVKANFDYMAGAVKQGVVKDWPTLVSNTHNANVSAVGSSVAETHPWHRFFFDVGTKLDSLKKAGQLDTPASWEAAWRAIAAGLQ